MLDGSEYFECQCGDIEHTIRLTVNEDPEDKAIWADVSLRKWQNIWQRIRNVWIGGTDYGHWDVTLFQHKEVSRLEATLRRIAPQSIPGNPGAESGDHVLWLNMQYDPDTGPELYTTITIRHVLSTWVDMWRDIRYIFGYRCRYGDWDCFEITPLAAANWLNLIEVYWNEVDKFNQKKANRTTS